MILRRCLVATVLASLCSTGFAQAEEIWPRLATDGTGGATIGECSGIAPVAVECSFHGTMPAVSTVHLEAQVEFTGRIGIRLVTDTGTYTGSCDFFGALDPVCRASTTGTLKIGQSYIAYGTASFADPATGTETKRVAAGRWRVFVTSP